MKKPQGAGGKRVVLQIRVPFEVPNVVRHPYKETLKGTLLWTATQVVTKTLNPLVLLPKT